MGSTSVIIKDRVKVIQSTITIDRSRKRYRIEASYRLHSTSVQFSELKGGTS